ncbi:MAG: hypothetical protein WB767_10600 [Nocardioides sp.]
MAAVQTSHSGRKLRYAELLSDAVDLASTPTPLLGLLRWIEARPTP